jgi:hypothetical protein
MSTKPRNVNFLEFFLIVLVAGALFTSLPAYAGGPRYVAGTTYFDPSVKGQPVLWRGGAISYFTDLGDLSPSVTNAVANETVAAAAAAWSALPTAAISITRAGSLAEDVNGRNVLVSSSGVTMPADTQRTAIATPVGVIYDADGAVIDAFFGSGASDPDDCIDSGVMNIVDNLATDGSIAHALILINGRCAGTAAQLEQIQFQLMRAFGRVLGLAWSQANDEVLSTTSTPSYQQLQGWPIMRPIDVNCDQLSTQCLPNPLQLRADDTSAISRLYPVTNANQANFSGKTITSTQTISIHGSVYFRRGQSMQGVNVVARPITPGVLQPDDRVPVTAVTGFLFTGNRGNVVTGAVDSNGEAVTDFGSDDTLLEGFYDLSGIPLPAGASVADYQITLEAVNPLYTGNLAVGPYALGSPTPSGTLPTITLRGLTAGMALEQDFTVADSAGDLQSAEGGSFAAPAVMPAAGQWQGRVVNPGQAAWFAIPVQAGRHFTIESQAMDALGGATEDKLRTVLGVWNASDAAGSPAAITTVAPFNGASAGVTALGVDAIGSGELLLGVADQRGDGRPDYTYQGRLLYAVTVTPERLLSTGGTIQIDGTGFRPGMTVMLGTQIFAVVTEITPTRILAIAPACATASGSLDLVVRDPITNGTAVIAAGISYGAAAGDTMSIATAPPATLNVAAAAPFSVRVFAPDQVTPVAGVPVTFSVVQGTALFSECGSSVCTLVTSGDGYATARVVPGSPGFIRLEAALTDSVSLDAELTGTTALAVLPVTDSLMVAPGAIVTWTPLVQVIQGNEPLNAAVIQWSAQAELSGQSGQSTTDAQGHTGFPFRIGPWPAGRSVPITACISSIGTGTQPCASFAVFVVHPESENLVPVSGVSQSMQVGAAAAPVVLRLIAPSGQPVVGGLVTFSASLRSWAPTCGPMGPCGEGTLLGVLLQTATSDADGLASFAPGIPSGKQVRLTGQATAGSSSTVPFTIEIHP